MLEAVFPLLAFLFGILAVKALFSVTAILIDYLPRKRGNG